MSGGTIFGNWATGRAVIVTAPTITVRIAMTMATMGRLMKNFDISLSPCLTRRAPLPIHIQVRLWVHYLALNCLLYALDDNALAGLQAFPDHPHRAESITDIYCLDADLVRAVQNGDLIIALEFADGRLWNE